MAGENTNLGLGQQGALGLSSLFTGNKDGQRIDHYWWDVENVLRNAGAIGAIGVFDDFLGDAIQDPWAPDLSNSGTAAINAQAGGVVRLTTDSGGTDHATLALGLHWLVSNGWTFFRTRIKQVSALTARKIEVGLSDAVSETNGLAFSSHDASVVAVATDAAVFAFNTGESVTTFSALTVNGGGTPQSATGLVTPSTSFKHLGIAISPAGVAYFFEGNPPTLVATISAAVATTALLGPWISVANTTTTPASMDVDFVAVHGAR